MENTLSKLCARLKEVGISCDYMSDNGEITIEVTEEENITLMVKDNSKFDYLLNEVKNRLLRDNHYFDIEYDEVEGRDCELLTEINSKPVRVFTLSEGNEITAYIKDADAFECEEIFDNAEQFYKALVRYLQS